MAATHLIEDYISSHHTDVMPSAASKKTGKVKPVPVDEDIHSDDVNSGPGSGSDSDDSNHSDSDSDSLDSDSPRKRRRTEPKDVQIVDDDDSDDDEDDVPKVIQSAYSVASRIKPQKSQADKKAEAVKATLPEPTTGVTVSTDSNTTFESLGVRPWLVQSLANMAIKRPTAIQRESIPMLLKGRDCIGGSRTGSGKTVAFSVPILQQWAENPSAIFGVILTPTRQDCPLTLARFHLIY